MTTLRSIVYVSTAVRPMSETELEALLLEARALNQKSATTGVLLYAEGGFMQCLEGPQDAVTQAYQRIRASRRHTGLIELLDEPVEVRSFPDWQMGFAQASRSDLLKLSSAEWQGRLATAPAASDTSGLSLLREFWRRASPLF